MYKFSVSLLLLIFSVLNIVCQDKESTNPLCEIKTSKGVVVLELFPKAAPETVENFLGLATGTKEYKDVKTGEMKKGNFYDGLIFHRVIPGFMAQGGCPMGSGMGGPGYKFKDEINGEGLGLKNQKVSNPQMIQSAARSKTFKDFAIDSQEDLDKADKTKLNEAFQENLKKMASLNVFELNEMSGYKYDANLEVQKNVSGTISMANSGPNTNGSQFFINVNDNVGLDGKHTVFGKVLKGMEVVQAIVSVPRNDDDKPYEDVKIISIRKLDKLDTEKKKE